MTNQPDPAIEKEHAREAELHRIIAVLTNQLEAMKRSTSWRLTRPLRGLRRMLGNLRQMSPDSPARRNLGVSRREGARLVGSELFDADYYARTYPDLAPAGADPLAHYLAAGAAEGRNPHPLFDSAHYRKQAGPVVDPLIHYLQVGGRQGLSPHPLFDGAYYLSANPDVAKAGANPLVHYVSCGARESRDPNPLFDTPTYLRVHPEAARDSSPLAHFLGRGSVPSAGAYASIDDLIAQQRKFLAQIQVRLLADRRTSPSPWAVLLQCGSTSQHHRWLTGAPRPWHLIVNHYDGTYAGTMPAEVETRQEGTKFSAVHALRTRRPEVLRGYRYVLLLDDDLLVSEEGLTTLFHTAEAQGLDLAQAALTPPSPGNWPVFRARPEGSIRYVNAVEIMMPLISSRALENACHLFAQTISGWGLDFALGKITSSAFGTTAAVIDSVSVEHLNVIDTQQGPYYRFLHSIGISPRVELRVLQRLYSTDRDFYEIRPAGGGSDGRGAAS